MELVTTREFNGVALQCYIRRVTVYDLQVFCNESSVLLDSAEKLLARIDGEATNE